MAALYSSHRTAPLCTGDASLSLPAERGGVSVYAVTLWGQDGAAPHWLNLGAAEAACIVAHFGARAAESDPAVLVAAFRALGPAGREAIRAALDIAQNTDPDFDTDD